MLALKNYFARTHYTILCMALMLIRIYNIALKKNVLSVYLSVLHWYGGGGQSIGSTDHEITAEPNDCEALQYYQRYIGT